MQRRALLLAMALFATGCGGGAPSRLHTLGKPSGSGDIDFQVENRTTAVVNNLFLVESAKVRGAGRPAQVSGSPEEAALWGQDLLAKSGLEPGGKLSIPIPRAGHYDVRAVDRDGREQHIANLRLTAGGRYVLELEEGGWRALR